MRHPSGAALDGAVIKRRVTKTRVTFVANATVHKLLASLSRQRFLGQAKGGDKDGER